MFFGSEFGARYEIEQRSKTASSVRGDGVEPGNRAAESSRQFGIPVHEIQLFYELRRQEVMPRNIHVVTGAEKNIIHNSPAAVAKLQFNLLTNRISS